MIHIRMLARLKMLCWVVVLFVTYATNVFAGKTPSSHRVFKPSLGSIGFFFFTLFFSLFARWVGGTAVTLHFHTCWMIDSLLFSYLLLHQWRKSWIARKMLLIFLSSLFTCNSTLISSFTCFDRTFTCIYVWGQPFCKSKAFKHPLYSIYIFPWMSSWLESKAELDLLLQSDGKYSWYGSNIWYLE